MLWGKISIHKKDGIWRWVRSVQAECQTKAYINEASTRKVGSWTRMTWLEAWLVWGYKLEKDWWDCGTSCLIDYGFSHTYVGNWESLFNCKMMQLKEFLRKVNMSVVHKMDEQKDFRQGVCSEIKENQKQTWDGSNTGRLHSKDTKRIGRT